MSVVGLKKTGFDDEPFGKSALKRLKIGDFVSWTLLEVDEDNDWYQKKIFGVLTDIVVEHIGGRDIYYGVVLPVKNNITCKVFLYLLEKATI